MFLILDGEFSISKKVRRRTKQPEQKILYSIFKDPLGVKQQQEFDKEGSHYIVVEHLLAYLGTGQLMGDEEIAYKKNETFSTSAKCISQTATLL